VQGGAVPEAFRNGVHVTVRVADAMGAKPRVVAVVRDIYGNWRARGGVRLAGVLVEGLLG
jgi:hypothetical protein